MLKEAGFPKRHRKALPDMHGVGLDMAKELLPKVLSGDCLLLLVGDRGPGKTQIATWLGWQRLLNGAPTKGHYVKCVDLIGEIKASWSDVSKGGRTESEVLKKCKQASFLVVDELHEKGASEWEARTLVNIIDHRYDNMLATLLIANLSIEQVKTQVNPSILSRAQQTGGVVPCDWPSYRRAQ